MLNATKCEQDITINTLQQQLCMLNKENIINKSCLSQWYKSDFIIDDVKYCCMEQYMMAEKAKLFNDSETLNLIMDETDQKTIKDLGRMVKNFNSNIWDENKYRYI